MARRAVVTRERILRAALIRFSSYGFRRTSMEDIAAEAGVSRAALYVQFANKEAIFRTLSEQLHDEALERAAAALGGDGSLSERLRAAVEAKSLRFVEIGYGSPHGGELLDESNRLCGSLAVEMEQRFRALLSRLFRHAAETKTIDLVALGLGAGEAAELFTRAIAGLKGPGVTVESYRMRLAALIRVFVAGLGARVETPASVTKAQKRSRRRDS